MRDDDLSIDDAMDDLSAGKRVPRELRSLTTPTFLYLGFQAPTALKGRPS